jgi:hypothetical protein
MSSSVARPELHRRPESANNNPLKRNGAAGDLTIVRPAAAAPPRRPEQVGRRRPPNLARARVHSEYGQRCQIPLIFPSVAAPSGGSVLSRDRPRYPFCHVTWADLLPLNLFVVMVTASAASFYAHVFFYKEYHVEESRLRRLA